MTPNETTEPQSKKHILLKSLIGIVVIAMIAGAAFLIVRTVDQKNIENEVKTELIKQNKLVKSTAKNNIFPSSFPEGVGASDKVAIEATVSADGSMYCIAATSKSHTEVVFHMDKASDEAVPLKGGCADSATVSPQTPSEFTLGSFGAGAVSFVWSKSVYAASYTLQCATNPSFAFGLKSTTVEKAATTLSGLESGTKYYCRISASNHVGQSAWSKTIEAVSSPISVAPKGLKVNTVSKSELSYSWDPVAGATEYILEYSSDIGFAKDVTSLKTTVTSGKLSGLKTYTAYYLHVKAVTPGFTADRASFSEMLLGRTAE